MEIKSFIMCMVKQIVVIRDVPALRCRINEHEYILEETLNIIERLLELEITQKLDRLKQSMYLYLA